MQTSAMHQSGRIFANALAGVLATALIAWGDVGSALSAAKPLRSVYVVAAEVSVSEEPRDGRAPVNERSVVI